MKGFPITNAVVRSLAIYHTFRNYRTKFLNFIQIVAMRAQTNSLRYKNAANNGRSSVKYRITYISKNWRGYKGKSAKIPKQNTRQETYRLIGILTENIALLNVSRLGNWHPTPSQLGLAILQGAQNYNRQECLWHFEARSESYC